MARNWVVATWDSATSSDRLLDWRVDLVQLCDSSTSADTLSLDFCKKDLLLFAYFSGWFAVSQFISLCILRLWWMVQLHGNRISCRLCWYVIGESALSKNPSRFIVRLVIRSIGWLVDLLLSSFSRVLCAFSSQAGAAAGTAVDVSLFPLDTIKTRLQSDLGFWGAGGFRNIYSGIGPTVLGSAPTGECFFRFQMR